MVKLIVILKTATVRTKKIIFATNGFLKSLGIKTNYNFPITLTASMTRPLTDKEFISIGEPKSGVFYQSDLWEQQLE